MSEQWTGDWMRDAETGQLIDGPAMSRYQMFMLIRELRAVIRAHAQTIRDKQAVIDAAMEKVARLEAPVSNDEWDRACTTALLDGCVESDEFAYRDEINAIIAARAKEPKP